MRTVLTQCLDFISQNIIIKLIVSLTKNVILGKGQACKILIQCIRQPCKTNCISEGSVSSIVSIVFV